MHQSLCDIGTDTFQKMNAIYQDGLGSVRALRSSGEKTVGCLGCDIPEEIVMAAGLVPVRIQGSSEIPLDEANRYLEYAFNPVSRAHFQRLVDGSYYTALDYLAISNSSDVLVRLYYYLRELRRTEPRKPVPPITFLDFLFTQRSMNQTYNYKLTEKFRQTVAAWVGREIDDESLRAAIAVCNENRALLKRFSEQRVNGAIWGSESLAVNGSSLLMRKEAHSELLRALLARLETASLSPIHAPRILLVGSVHEEDGFYKLTERCGGNIVAEDHDWGDRIWDTAVAEDGPPLYAISNRYMLRMASAKKSTVAQRVAALRNQVAQVKPDGVVFFNRQYDDPASWDYPEQAKLLRELDIPFTAFHAVPYDLAQAPELEHDLADFIKQLENRVVDER